MQKMANRELGDLATVISTQKNAIQTNQKTTLLLNGWPRTIAEIMATATEFMRFSRLIVLFFVMTLV